MKKYLLLLTINIFLFFLNAFSQNPVLVTYGLIGDLVYRSSISNLDATILSEPVFLQSTFDMRKKTVTSFSYGMFGNIMASKWLCFNLDLNYSQQHSQLKFNNYITNFRYDMNFNYNYINIMPSFRVYPILHSEDCHDRLYPRDYYGGLYLMAGMQFGIPLEKDNSITYKSENSLAAFGSDTEQEQQLNLVLKPRANVGLMLGLGSEFNLPIPFSLNFKYHYGISDVVETLPNPYNFISNKNTNSYIQLGLSIFISGRNN